MGNMKDKCIVYITVYFTDNLVLPESYDLTNLYITTNNFKEV